MEDDLDKTKRQTKMKDNPKKNKNGKQPKKWKTKQSTKINPIGCDTIVNSPSFLLLLVGLW